MISLKWNSLKLYLKIGLLFFSCIKIQSQGKWMALQSPVAFSIDKMISTTDKKLFINMPASGIQYSNDLGEHWIPKNEGLEAVQGYSSMIAGPKGSVIITSADKIYILKDVNSNWAFLNSLGLKIDAIYTGANNRIFCILGQTVYVSDDEGLSFKYYFTSPHMYGTIKEFTYNGSDQNYFIDENGYNFNLYKFDDKANSIDSILSESNLHNLVWHRSGKLFLKVYSDIFHFDEKTKILNRIPGINQQGSICKDSYNNLIIFDTVSVKSIDGGLNWTPLSKANYNFNLFSFVDSFLFTASNSCNNPVLNRYFNFDSLQTDLTNVFTQPNVNAFLLDSVNQLFVSTCHNYSSKFSHIKRTTDQGKTWTIPQIFGKEILNLKKNNSNTYYAVCDDSTYTSKDFGNTWTSLKYVILPSGDFCIAPDHTLYLTQLHGPYLVHMKEDGSDSKLVEPGICCDGTIYNLLFHPNGRIFIIWSGYLFYSDEKGEHAKYNYNNNPIRCRSCDLSSLGDLYTIDDGLNFVDPDLNTKYLIEPVPNTARVIGHDKDNNVFVYDQVKGLLQCNKSGCKPFDMTGLPFPFMSISTLYQDENNYLYAGLINDKIYKYNLPVVANANLSSSDSAIFQVFPNPFTSVLNCSVKNTESGNYHVVIEDLMGRPIFETTKSLSHFSIETESIASGIYCIRVNNSIFKKIIKF